MFVRYRRWEYDPARPHVVIGASTLEVELEELSAFHSWAAMHWPAPRWRTELLPGQGLTSLRLTD